MLFLYFNLFFVYNNSFEDRLFQALRSWGDAWVKGTWKYERVIWEKRKSLNKNDLDQVFWARETEPPILTSSGLPFAVNHQKLNAKSL